VTLFEKLADQNIRLRRLDPGHTEHINCPFCGGGTHRDKGTLAVTIDQDGMGATWICHRGSCGRTGGVTTRGHETATPRPPGSRYTASRPSPASPPPDFAEARPAWFWSFWNDRHIGAKTVEHFEVYADTHYFGGGIGPDHPCIVFPYRWGGRGIVGRKYRPFPEKSPQAQDAPNPPILYNAGSLRDSVQIAIWVEGEPDVLAVHEAIPQADGNRYAIVSLKDGAPAEAKFDPDDRRFEALRTHAKELAKIQTHVICTDLDAPGEALAEELARRLGRHKCRRWTLPEGCKDACDVLVNTEHRSKTLWDCIQNAKAYPMRGIRHVPEGYLDNLHAKPPPATMRINRVLNAPTEGRLIVVTGVPNHGKSTWLRHTMIHTAIKHQRKWLAYVGEDDFDSAVIECAEQIAAEPFRTVVKERAPTRMAMSQAQRQSANTIISEHIRFLEYDNEDDPVTLDSLLERGAYSVLCHGTTDLALDPYNEIEHQRGDQQSETDYISRFLQRSKTFAKRYGCNVWIITHPVKPPPQRKEEKRPPTGYDIAGSANWANKADLGITIWRPEPGIADLIVWKSRTKRWATAGMQTRLTFDRDTSSYHELEPEQPQPRNYNETSED